MRVGKGHASGGSITPVFGGTTAAAPNAPPLLKNKKLVNNKPTAYICQDYVCKKPTTKPDELANQLVDQ